MTKTTITRVLTVAIMLLALVMSFLHIAEAFQLMGTTWEHWTAPVLIDVTAILGKLYSGREFTAATRKLGRWALYVAGTVSLTCNVAVGWAQEQYGTAALGAIVISVALFGEHLLAHAKVAAPRKPAATKAAPAKAPIDYKARAAKAAATRAAKAAPAPVIPAQRATAHDTFPAYL
jgi:hypothetical protein